MDESFQEKACRPQHDVWPNRTVKQHLSLLHLSLLTCKHTGAGKSTEKHMRTEI